MKLNNETKIGILVAAAVGMLLALTFKAGDFHFSKKGYPLKVRFHQIDGVEANAPVRFNGLEVGQVQDIHVLYGEPATQMELVLLINDGVKIRQGAAAHVKNMGLLGEKYIGLTDGQSGAAYLGPDSVVEGEDPADFDRLLAKGEAIGNSLQEISANVNERLKINSQHIDDIMEHLDLSMTRLSSITANIDQRLTVNGPAIDETMANLNLISRNLAELSEDLKKNPWKLLHKQKESGAGRKK